MRLKEADEVHSFEQNAQTFQPKNSWGIAKDILLMLRYDGSTL